MIHICHVMGMLGEVGQDQVEVVEAVTEAKAERMMLYRHKTGDRNNRTEGQKSRRGYAATTTVSIEFLVKILLLTFTRLRLLFSRCKLQVFTWRRRSCTVAVASNAERNDAVHVNDDQRHVSRCKRWDASQRQRIRPTRADRHAATPSTTHATPGGGALPSFWRATRRTGPHTPHANR